MIKKILLSLFISSLLLTSSSLAAIQTLPNHKVKINGKTIPMDPPLIKENSTVYFPLRNVLDPLDISYSYSRKKDLYILKLPNTQKKIILLPRSKEIWINDTLHYLNTPSIRYHNRLYVPLNSFMKLSGITKKQVDKTIHISHKSKKVKQKQSKHIISKTNYFPITDQSLPFFESDRKLHLKTATKKINVTKKFFYKNNELFVALDPFIKSQGYKIKQVENTLQLKKKNHRISIKKKSVTISEKSTKYNHLSAPIITRNGTRYYPFISTMTILGFGLDWDAEKRTILCLSKIKEVIWVKTKSGPKLVLLSKHTIKATEATTLRWRSGYQFDIPYSIPALESKSIKTPSGIAKRISISRVNNRHTRIKIQTEEDAYAPHITHRKKGVVITLNLILKKIEESAKSKSVIVKIKGSHPFKVSPLIEGKKLIMDIPNSHSEMALIKRSRLGSYQRIRTSQLNENTSRIVIDFDEKVPSFSLTTKGSEVSLSFPRKKIATPPVISKATSKKKRKQQISKSKPAKSKSRQKLSASSGKTSLRNRVILIDPGHGGRDPGAIGLNKEYEKNYTYDISVRLRKLLAKSGAFVIMTRDKDINRSLSRRAQIANKNDVDIFVSIHLNSFINSKARGTETYYYKYKDKKLARHLQKQMAKDLKLKNNGLKRSRLYVLRHSKMPAALVEPAFLTNPRDLKKVNTSAFRQKIADSIYQGIINYFKDA